MDASTDEDDELDAARMSATMPQQPLGVALGDVEVRAHVIGEVRLLDREIEVAEDRGERSAQLVRHRGHQLVARTQRVQLGRDVARDDHCAGILTRRVGEAARCDAQRLPRPRLLAEPDHLARRTPRRAAPARAAARRAGSRVTPSSRNAGTSASASSSDRIACCSRPCASFVTATWPSAAMRMTPKSTASSTSVTSCSCRRVRSSTRRSSRACFASRVRCASERRAAEMAGGRHRDEHERQQHGRVGDLLLVQGRQHADDARDRHDDREQPEQSEAGREPRRREDPEQTQRRTGRGDLHQGDRDDVDRRHDRDPSEGDAIPRDDERRAGEHEDHDDAGEEQDDVAGEGPDRYQDRRGRTPRSRAAAG